MDVLTMRQQQNYPGLGSVSSGTMREEDLIPAFMAVLDEYNPDAAAELREKNPDVFEWLDDSETETDDDLWEVISEFLNEQLWSALDELAPPYVYFGSHPGDGADYGYWPSMESIDEDARFQDGIIKIEAGSEWPDDMDGIDYVAEVTDHGNVTLFDAHTKEEIWSVV